MILILTALLACVIIVINGFLIVRRAFHEVLDGNVSTEISAEMRDGALEVTGVARVEKCRVRKGGIGLFVELHVWVDGDMPVRVGHQIGHTVKDHLRAIYPHIVDVVVHLEPQEAIALS